MNISQLFPRKYLIYFIMFLGVALIVGISLYNDVGVGAIVSEIVAVLSVEILVLELYQSRKISEAQFLADLNQNFVTNDDYKKAYQLFENYDFETCPDLDLDNIHISNYLTFFEVFEMLIDRGTLSLELVNDLFGYRFFIAVHNPYVQKKKLVKSPENFRNLYVLEHDWMEYRRKNGLPIFHEEYALENVVDKEIYEKLSID